jgi:hypothetical protein
LKDEVFEAELSTENSASRCGQSVVLIYGEAAVPVDMRVIGASPEELAMLPAGWRGAIALDP